MNLINLLGNLRSECVITFGLKRDSQMKPGNNNLQSKNILFYYKIFMKYISFQH